MIEWRIYKDEDGTPHMIVFDGKERIATVEECERACRILNEDGSNVVKVFCKTEGCNAKGGWIERTRANLEKTVYKCEGSCGRPMER